MKIQSSVRPHSGNGLLLIFAGFLFVTLLAGSLCFPRNALADLSQEELKQAVRQILKDNPDLVLDILKEHSETVLEVAQQGNLLRKRKAVRAQWDEDAKHPKKTDLQNRVFRGAQDAPVTITAYSDFTCPYCRQAEQTLAKLLEKYKGKIRLTFKALPKEDAASVALAKYSCAAFLLDADKGWEFYDFLFRSVEEFEQKGEAFIKKAAEDMGFDYRKLKAEAASAQVQKRLDDDRREADGLGITGTPYFLVNDLLVRGAVSPDIFEEAIERSLAAKKK